MNSKPEMKHLYRLTLAILLCVLAPYCLADQFTYLRIDSEISMTEVETTSKSTAYLVVGTKTEHVLNHPKTTPAVKLIITPTSYAGAVLAVDTLLSVTRLVNPKENRFEKREHPRNFKVKLGEAASADSIDGVRFSWTARRVTEAEFKAALEQIARNSQNLK